MNYISTRGGSPRVRFSEVLLEGLAPDGGLYLPEVYPKVDDASLAHWRRIYHQQGYAELAFEVLSLYIDDIPAADLRSLCAKTYTADVFGTGEIVPLRHLENGIWLEALSNGPTLAFKDMGMQFLGNLFEYELARRGEALNIVGATSGDTGSAAEYAMKGKKGIRVFMTSPAGRMSVFQQAQMFSLMDDNIFNLSVEGVFDDCQDMVKAVCNDLDFKRHYKLGVVNSINWARLVAQVVYYFAGYFQATETLADRQAPVSFAIPSGNFGNAFAGHVARKMGLPIRNLVIATNENDVLDEFFRTGIYRIHPETLETSSPSMDISRASNFERTVFDLVRDGGRVRTMFTETLPRQGRLDLSEALENCTYFKSGSSKHSNRLSTIKDCYDRHAMMIDPHTADGVKVARDYLETGVPMIVLETALPAKFADTLREATGSLPDRPTRLDGLEALPRRVIPIAADVQALKAFIAQVCDGRMA